LRAVGEPIFGMEASRISMGRLLAHLFEVTERFGMQTRTELILLQRTMVVVEGVARTLDPHMNIWDAARPVVEGYIRDSLGPKAFARDLAKSAWILARFSPRLPELARAALVRTATPAPNWRPGLLLASLYIVAGAVLGALGTLAFNLF
jgi:ubiquinone biosynthesis protein